MSTKLLRIFLAVLALGAASTAAAQYVTDYKINGWTYTGNMSNGKRHGKGKAISPKGNLYSGEWVDDTLPYGRLEATDDGAKYVYEGEFNTRFSPHGYGRMSYKTGKNKGAVYIGNFENGYRQGMGKLTNADGTMSFGRWQKGQLKTPTEQKFKVEDHVYGIDVSHHNVNIDWDNLAIYCDSWGRVTDGDKAEIASKKYMLPVSFVYVRAEEGATGGEDRMYATHFKNSLRHFYPTGSYHYMRFTTSSVEDQVETFLRRSNKCLNDELPPMLDLENGPDNNHDASKCEKGQPGGVQLMADKWLKQVEAEVGKRPLVYTNDQFIKNFLRPERLKNFKVWIARYGSEPEYHPWMIWQFTDRGKIQGVNDAQGIDINYWDGNYKHFQRHMLK